MWAFWLFIISCLLLVLCFIAMVIIKIIQHRKQNDLKNKGKKKGK